MRLLRFLKRSQSKKQPEAEKVRTAAILPPYPAPYPAPPRRVPSLVISDAPNRGLCLHLSFGGVSDSCSCFFCNLESPLQLVS